MLTSHDVLPAAPCAAIATRNTGFGLGLRTPHYADFLARKQPLDWLEIVTDNYLIDGGKPLAILDTIRRDYPMAMHGVAMSIGASHGLDLDYLRRVKALADRIQPLWISDHLCWIGHGPQQLHDLYPLPYTDEAARHVINQIQHAQDVLGRRLVIENVSSYIRYSHSSAHEWQFLSHIAQAADCLLLVDVNNIYVSSVNHGFDPLEYLNALPAHRVQQIHLAGHCDQGDHIIDTHDHPVAGAVWDLYAHACRRFGAVATMIERDDHIPPLQDVLDEMAVARNIAATNIPAVAHAAPHAAYEVGAQTANTPNGVCWSGMTPTISPALTDVQHRLAKQILAPAPDKSSPCTPDAEDTVSGRFHIYHHAYRARLGDALADTFAKTCLFMGSDAFERHARDYAVTEPPLARSLNRYGHRFAAYLQLQYPDNPELYEIAQLDWDLRTRFDCADHAALAAADVQADGAAHWLQRASPLHSSVLLRAITTNVVQLWNAIDAGHDVPEAKPLATAATLVVWRKAHQPHFKTLEKSHADFVRLLGAGASINEACATLETNSELPDMPTFSIWLRELLDEALLCARPQQEQELAQP